MPLATSLTNLDWQVYLQQDSFLLKHIGVLGT